MVLVLPKANVELNLCRDAEASGSLVPDSTGHVWVLETLETTRALGRHLARELPTGAILLLSGALGAGKTSLVQGIAQGLQIDEPITSPTFALAQHYQGLGGALAHLDLYRLESAFSADELFCQEEEEANALGAFMAVEWPERLSFNPKDARKLNLELLDPNNPDAGRVARLQI